MEIFSLTDLLFTPLVAAIIFLLTRSYAKKQRIEKPYYKYYLPAISAKLFGGLALCFVYTVYYPGGDTLQYYIDAMCFVRLFFHDPVGFFTVYFHSHEASHLLFFNINTGYPVYYRDPETFFVVKLVFILVMISMKSFLVATLLVTTLSFFGIWRLYKVFLSEFPELEKQMAIAFLFIPSVFFWGSGILKDTFTFSAIGFFISSFYMAFIKGKRIVPNSLTVIISGFFIVSIKPYILVGLIPGLLFWMVHKLLSRIKGQIARVAALPVFILITGILGYGVLLLLSGHLEEYSMDRILTKAVVTQKDLKSEYYQGNSFDIGDLQPTVQSMIEHAPQAIAAAFYRPFIWEVKNIVMFISSIENLIILLFTIKVLLMVKIVLLYKYLLRHHLLTFSLIFSFFFAFSVGISTSNFGSMVRYKIPCIPFYVASLYIIQYYRRKDNESKEIILPYTELQKKILSVS